MVIRMCLGTACLAALTVFAPVQAAVDIRIGGTGNADGPDTKAMEVFKTEVESELGKDVSVKLFPNSTLGTWGEMAEQVRGGALQCVYESVGVLGSFHAAANVEGVAYLYRDDDHFFRVWQGPVGKEILDSIAAQSGFKVIGPAFRGFRQFLVKKPVDGLANLQGMKVRVPGIPTYIESIRALGVSPTTLAFEEAYTGIQQGVADGLEQPLVAIKDHRFYEVAKHLVITNHMAETMGFLCNQAWYQKLDDRTKRAVEKAGASSATWYRKYTRENQQALIGQLKAAGVTVHEPKLEEFRQRAASAKHDPKLQPIIDKIRAVK